MEHAIVYRERIPDERYPESDGRPMGETDFHITAIVYLLSALRFFFSRLPDVYAASNMLLYYEQDYQGMFVVPDVFVVRGTDKHMRRMFKTWEEKTNPTVIFEITSRGTRLEDLTTKHGLYQLLGVQEYFLFDPLDEYLKPRLQGFQLHDGEYQHIAPDAQGNLFSHALGLILQPDDKLLRIVDPATNKIVPTLDEAMEMVEEEATRANLAEAELARLKEELKRLQQNDE